MILWIIQECWHYSKRQETKVVKWHVRTWSKYFHIFIWHVWCILTHLINLCFITRSIIKYFRWNYFWYSPSLLHFIYILLFSSHSRIFHSYGDVTIAGERLQILTCARHSWPLSSECSFACHSYCDTEHPSIMVISEDPWHSHLLPSV